MTLRLVSAAILAAATLIATTGVLSAQTYTNQNDPEGRFSGGSPRGKIYTAFGGYENYSPIPKSTVSFGDTYSPGTIIINTTERRLYYVVGGGQAIRYGIGVGRLGFTWAGTTAVSAKKEWPDWTPPSQMLARRPDLPRHMKGGIDNPLGARAMYLYTGGRDTMFRIHGSNEPDSIGQAVSSGCIRMLNDDVVDLFSRVKVGTTVVVL